ADESKLSDAERAAFYYARLVALAEVGHNAVADGKAPDVQIKLTRLAFVRIIELLRAGIFEARLLALTALPYDERDPLASHAANVSVLALALGRLLGLKRGALADLAFAAYWHDVGRAPGFRGEAGAGKPDAQASQAHIAKGVAVALRGRGYGDAGLLRVVVAQEHHVKTDGYPQLEGDRGVHPLSRLVGVANAFDELEHGTPWAKALGP